MRLYSLKRRLFPLWTGLGIGFLCLVAYLSTNQLQTQSQVNEHPNGKTLVQPRQYLYNITMKTDISGGKTGNNMFQYAALVALAKRNKKHAFIQTKMFLRLLGIFELTLPVEDDINTDSYNFVKDKQEDAPESLARLTRLPNGHILLAGQFQSFRFFHQIRQEIRKEFTFKKSVHEQAVKFLSENPPKQWTNFTRVGIHIRRTDHIRPEFVANGFFFPEYAYFSAAMDYFLARNEQVQFVVASDDIEFCKNFFKNSSNEFLFSENNYGVDLAILASCDHVIITIGTFGWWAGWLNKGTTIHMKDFPPNGTWAAKVYRPKYYIPEDDEYNHWVGL